MSNRERAAQMIRDLSEVDGETLGYAHVHNIAQALANAGLLASDLPEPSHGSEGALLWHSEEVWVEDDENAVYIDLPKSFGRMTPSQTRRLGYALIAAANHAEAEDD